MSEEPRPEAMRRSDFDQHASEKSASSQEKPTETCESCGVAQQAQEVREQESSKDNARGDVQQIHGSIGDRGGWIPVDVRGREHQKGDEASQPATRMLSGHIFSQA